MSTRPRPRPRPKPAPAASTSNASPSKTPVNQDDDTFFIKNRSRDTERWKKLEQRERQQAKLPSDHSSDEDNDNFEFIDDSPKSRKFNKKQNDELPNWTKSRIKRLLSPDMIDVDEGDESSDVEKEEQKGKRKRSESRSRSITPPPEIPFLALQNAKNIVRRALHSEVRPPSPPIIPDNSTDVIDLDPELALIAQNVRNQSQSQSSFTEDSFSLGDAMGGPELINIKMKWIPHPEDDAGRSNTWDFVIKRHDTFKTLFEETADLATVLLSSLVVTYDGKQIFSSVTPHSLRIWAQAELEACNKTTYEFIRNRRHSDASSPRHGTDPVDGALLEPVTESDDEPAGVDKFKLTLRSVDYKDITVTVRSTTKCEDILKEFMKRNGLDAPISPTRQKGKGAGKGLALMVDGERLDPRSEVGVADLEDGDMVEVVGL